ncbi:uncharacterized protein C13orf42 [Trichomycterus rosablanca]|uniref:uncharacterized protein C13orf42 n=1 Tax=Trichomycterus rosablanca TaxID=2290929 RepID=UPI002F34FCF5
MLKKINAVLRPNRSPHARGGYHSACTVRLVRSASTLAVSERSRAELTLKRSASVVSVQSGTALYNREEHVWRYSKNQECLHYLQELVELRRRYTKCVSDFKYGERKKDASSKKKPATQPPQHEDAQHMSPQPFAQPIPNEEDTLQFFDEVIASCDSEHSRKPHVDDGHEDVDFIVATSTCQHDLHSNWVLRDPRRISINESRMKHAEVEASENVWRKAESANTGSLRRLQRNPIHLPKVVESALQTLRFKPKLNLKKV